MYPMLMPGVSCTPSSRFFQRRVGLPTRPLIPIFRLRPSPFRPASDLNPSLSSVVFPSPRLLIDVVLPPLLFNSFWSILRFPVTSILPPHLSGCRLSVLRCSYSCASSPHRKILVSASPPPRLRLRRLIISLLLYRYLHCRYPGGLFGFHVAILAPRSSPLGGTYCHKPRVTALAHLLKTVP